MIREIAMAFIIIACLSATAAAQSEDRILLMPVFSLEAVEVNTVPVPKESSAKVTVAPGDVIVAKVKIRNWSPNGQKLRGFQAQMDPIGYRSGTAGTVQPVGFEPGTNNEANAFIDTNDPDYVHKGLASIPLTDAASESYRWLNVLLEAEEGPVSNQDSVKYNCATLRLKASADASGTFTIGFVEEPSTTGLLDPGNNLIIPIGYEPLVVEIKADAKWFRIETSDPPSGAIDGRIIMTPTGKNDPAWKSIKLYFNGPAANLSASDFVVEDGSSSPPKIIDVKIIGPEATLMLDRGIRPGTWTVFMHKASGSSTRIGRLAGDASNDGRADADDLMVLLRGLNGAAVLSDFQADLNADGEKNARDVLRLIDLLTDGHPHRSKLGK